MASSTMAYLPYQQETKERKCPVKGCSLKCRNFGRHVREKHLPCRFRTPNLENLDQHDERLDALNWLQMNLPSSGRTLRDLMAWVRDQRAIPRDATLDQSTESWLKESCRRGGWKVPQHFSLQTLNSEVLLFHWRVLVVCLNHLSVEDRRHFHLMDAREIRPHSSDSEQDMTELQVVDETGFNEPDQPTLLDVPLTREVVMLEVTEHPTTPADPVKVTEQPTTTLLDVPSTRDVVILEVTEHPTTPADPVRVTEQHTTSADPVKVTEQPTTDATPIKVKQEAASSADSTLPTGIDSHFHLDRSARLLKAKIDDPRDLINKDVGPAPICPVNIAGGVCVYCDPEKYPDFFPSSPGFKCAVGVHPKKVQYFTPQKEEQFRRLLSHPEVSALGEVGLDRTEPEETWVLQEEIFTKIMMYNAPWRTCVIHIRDPMDVHAGELYTKCLQIMKANASPTQRIHLHCFTGTTEQVMSWSQAFPYTSFGFTSNVQRFDKFQREAVKRIPEDRIVLETDSPYLPPVPGLRVNTPAYLGHVAKSISEIRGQSLETVLKYCTANARSLYHL